MNLCYSRDARPERDRARDGDGPRTHSQSGARTGARGRGAARGRRARRRRRCCQRCCRARRPARRPRPPAGQQPARPRTCSAPARRARSRAGTHAARPAAATPCRAGARLRGRAAWPGPACALEAALGPPGRARGAPQRAQAAGPAHPAGSGDQPRGEPPQALPYEPQRAGGDPPRTARSAMATACAAARPGRPPDSERGADVCSSIFPYCAGAGAGCSDRGCERVRRQQQPFKGRACRSLWQKPSSAPAPPLRAASRASTCAPGPAWPSGRRAAVPANAPAVRLGFPGTPAGGLPGNPFALAPSRPGHSTLPRNPATGQRPAAGARGRGRPQARLASESTAATRSSASSAGEYRPASARAQARRRGQTIAAPAAAPVAAASSLKWKLAMAAATHSATGGARISVALMLWSSRNSSTRPLQKRACREPPAGQRRGRAVRSGGSQGGAGARQQARPQAGARHRREDALLVAAAEQRVGLAKHPHQHKLPPARAVSACSACSCMGMAGAPLAHLAGAQVLHAEDDIGHCPGYLHRRHCVRVDLRGRAASHRLSAAASPAGAPAACRAGRSSHLFPAAQLAEQRQQGFRGVALRQLAHVRLKVQRARVAHAHRGKNQTQGDPPQLAWGAQLLQESSSGPGAALKAA